MENVDNAIEMKDGMVNNVYVLPTIIESMEYAQLVI